MRPWPTPPGLLKCSGVPRNLAQITGVLIPPPHRTTRGLRVQAAIVQPHALKQGAGTRQYNATQLQLQSHLLCYVSYTIICMECAPFQCPEMSVNCE
eukprot:4358640-Heterocapsa_arctica.AAC.1